MSCIGSIPQAYVEMRNLARRISFWRKTHLPSCANRPINFSITVSKHMKFRIIFLRHLLLEIPVYPAVPMKKPVNVTHLSEARARLCDLMLTSVV